MHNDQHRIKVKREQLTTWEALEGVFYEIKPLLYMTFAFTAIRGPGTSTLWIKYTALSILIYGAYITFCRLSNRGHI
jgi:hypothetical protein